MSVRHLCDIYGVGSSTVYDLKKQKEKILKFYVDSDSKKRMGIRKTMKDSKSTELDKAMIQWFRLRQNDGVNISGDMVMEQAKIFHRELNLDYDCDYTQGWLQRFKQHHGISFHAVCGEKRSVDKEAAAQYVEDFAKLVADEHLSPEQVYNADETALYWHCMPRKTLAIEDEETPTGLKDSKDRVTILGCSNAAGTHRCKLLVIGKSLHPRALKGVKRYPVIYRANKKGWITTQITLEWFEHYFVPEARAHCTSVGLDRNCKILLILDNCSAHPSVDLLVKNNVVGVYLPSNCTLLIQPQDQGILCSLKCKYRSQFMKRLLSVVNSGKSVQTFIKEFNMKDVFWFIASAWEMVEPSTLKNGWHRLWPALMFESSPDEDPDAEFTGFRVSKEKEIVHDLLEYANTMTDTAAKTVATELSEDNIEEWMDVDIDAPVGHQLSDSEIVEMIVNSDKNKENKGETSDENEEDVAEKISIERCIHLATELIAGLEQRSFITGQEIMNIYLLQDKLITERPKYMKQVWLQDMFKKITKKNAAQLSTVENPVASTSAAPDVPASTSAAPDVPASTSPAPDVITINTQDETESNPDSPPLPEL
ncbi:tigger transposable element-derived protein 2-like [Latimeria chalumnae]|uniref:tigger transposable element-derived protein 2-like n=1 Tax=Latimeria chalumnae TaxID=7897 RepID=UPI00313D449D